MLHGQKRTENSHDENRQDLFSKRYVAFAGATGICFVVVLLAGNAE